jgi:ABC-type transport system substrate-binding protein
MIPWMQASRKLGPDPRGRSLRYASAKRSWRNGVARVALTLAVLAACECCMSRAATAPRYGGTLIVELHTPALVLDPAKWRPGAPENAADLQLASAVFDRLVTLDRFGRFQPALATEWSHDGAWRRWQFTLRSGVQFSDGSALTAADVATALQDLASAFSPGKPTVTASGNHVMMQFASPVADLLEQLASGRFFIFRRTGDDTLLGTGPFYIAAVLPSAGAGFPHYDFAANEHCWWGRPFVDRMQVSLGVPILRQLFDLQLGKAHVVELSPELVRRAAQENLRVWSSAPVLLYALQISPELPAESHSSLHADSHGDATAPSGAAAAVRLGEVLSLALDRDTMANVVLQKQAEPAASFLPQWLSGYASVFNTENDVERAKKISAALFGAPGTQSAAQPLHLRVDAPGDLARLIAERVAINARQAGISVQLPSRSSVVRESSAAGSGGSAASGNGKNADAAGKPADLGALRLIAWRYSSLSERAELDAMIATLQLGKPESETSPADAEEVFSREQRLIAERGLIPLVVMPEYIGLGSPVRDWMPERWGAWHLADVWLDEKHSDAPETATGRRQR